MAMPSLPKPLEQAINFFQKLPSIGPKTAKRLAFYLLRMPQEDLDEFSNNLTELKKKSLRCNICLNLTEKKVCSICQNNQRDKSIIMIVEDVLDLLSLEAGDQYQGVYHVLHGRIDPLNYVSPDDIYINHLLQRIKKEGENVKEIILATNPNMEGEATAMHIKKRLEEIKGKNHFKFKLTRLAYGLPIGADLEYADYMTLKKAMEGRREY